MSVLYVISCDKCGASTEPSAASPSSIRGAYEPKGWASKNAKSGSKDLCSSCVPRKRVDQKKQTLERYAATLPVGSVHGAWTVIGAVNTDTRPAQVPCRCACGVERLVHARSVAFGLSMSCGCLRDARAVRRVQR